MNRWVLAVVAASAVVLALLLIRGPDTGERPAAPLPPALTAPASPEPAPTRRPPALQGREDLTATPGSVPDQLADPNVSPEVKAAAAVSSQWGVVARRLSYTPGSPATWKPLGTEALELGKQIRAFRTNPDDMDWAALETEQRGLIPRIRAAEPDDILVAALDEIEAQLAD